MAALSVEQILMGLIPAGRPKIYADTDGEMRDNADICCPLPFFLQDLCLLVVINELDCYPTELLAALPYWLRYRILSNVPALDLSRLETTLVACGIDVDGIWKSRVKAAESSSQTRYQSIFSQGSNEVGTKQSSSPFQLNVSRDRDLFSSTHLPYSYHGRNAFEKDIIKELDVKDSELSIGNQYLLKIASDLLTTPYGTDLEKATRQLVAIPGKLMMSNLLLGSVHQDCHNPLCCTEVWKKQAAALIVKEVSMYSQRYYRRWDDNISVHLVPRRLLHFFDKPDPVELLSLLLKYDQLHPHSVSIRIDSISQSFLPGLRAERLALDGNLSLPTDDAKYTSIISCLLGNVVSLRLQCDKYGLIGIMVSMIKAAIANDQASNLKHLICAIPDLYMDIVDPLCALFSQYNFLLLSLELGNAYPLMLSKLLRAFIKAPCPHTHKLLIHVKGNTQFQMTLKENQVAAVDMKGVIIPSCGLQHKVLKFSTRDDLTRTLYLLLQFPTIRLKGIELFTNSEYLHLCAIHPNLQLTKLSITIAGNAKRHRQHSPLADTLQQDIVSLFRISSLEKVRIRGDWGPLTEVKLSLVLGLRSRSQLSPLTKLSFELESQHSYKVREFEMLCDALFSLPKLENLNLVLGKGYADMLRQQRYEDVMYKSWSRKGGRINLKSITLQTDIKKDLNKVTLLTQNLSLSSQDRYGVYSPYYGDHEYYDDDDYNPHYYSEYDFDPWDFHYDFDRY